METPIAVMVSYSAPSSQMKTGKRPTIPREKNCIEPKENNPERISLSLMPIIIFPGTKERNRYATFPFCIMPHLNPNYDDEYRTHRPFFYVLKHRHYRQETSRRKRPPFPHLTSQDRFLSFKNSSSFSLFLERHPQSPDKFLILKGLGFFF